ncbi:hemicentin-2-like isoform X1 [Haliotis rufescens]|uniref:hemicentin-2-like isoform X1 n=2 Tax=Haliotis rufescens TaxID=6454 RepID=UPI00201F442E|nr:hemicentin-2-like isoform X1 [Haliotis rufescens]
MLKIPLAILVMTAAYDTVANSHSWKERAPLMTKNATDGQPVSLTCRTPPPGKVKWFKIAGPEGKLFQVNVDPRIQISTRGTLHFAHVNILDTAVYKCSVSGFSTIELGSPVQLYVTKGNIADTWPTLLCSSETTHATLGQDVSLQCIFSGRPVPVVTWYRDINQVTNTARVKLSHTSVTIKNVSEGDTGTYRCTGKNNVASSSHEVTLIVKYPDEATTSVSVEIRPNRTNLPALDNNEVTTDALQTGLHETTVSAVQSDVTSPNQVPGVPALYTIIAVTSGTFLALLVLSSAAICINGYCLRKGKDEYRLRVQVAKLCDRDSTYETINEDEVTNQYERPLRKCMPIYLEPEQPGM